MKKFLLRTVSPIIAGLVTSFIIMMAFEYANSFMFPIPKYLDINDIESVRNFTASLPWNAYILVLLGYVIGSFKAGCVASYLSKDTKYRTALAVGIILTFLGIMNSFIIGHAIEFNIISLPLFLIFTYLGHKFLVRKRRV